MNAVNYLLDGETVVLHMLKKINMVDITLHGTVTKYFILFYKFLKLFNLKKTNEYFFPNKDSLY